MLALECYVKMFEVLINLKVYKSKKDQIKIIAVYKIYLPKTNKTNKISLIIKWLYLITLVIFKLPQDI
jgi:hypothetical protein